MLVHKLLLLKNVHTKKTISHMIYIFLLFVTNNTHHNTNAFLPRTSSDKMYMDKKKKR